jgi:hypothetical protein
MKPKAIRVIMTVDFPPNFPEEGGDGKCAFEIQVNPGHTKPIVEQLKIIKTLFNAQIDNRISTYGPEPLSPDSSRN